LFSPATSGEKSRAKANDLTALALVVGGTRDGLLTNVLHRLVPPLRLRPRFRQYLFIKKEQVACQVPLTGCTRHTFASWVPAAKGLTRGRMRGRIARASYTAVTLPSQLSGYHLLAPVSTFGHEGGVR
jgi:hypothetical protein